MAELDIENFMIAIKERPALWDLSVDDYSNRGLKKRMWKDITFLFGGSECSTEKEKTALCASLQKKWRNLKDCFCREKRRISGVKSGSAADRKSPYIYYNLMSFLNKGTPPTNTQSSMTAQDPEDADTPQLDRNPTGPYQPTTVPKKKKKTEDDVGIQLVKVLKSSAEHRRKFEEEVLQDEDKLFLLYLVNEFKNKPQERKLSAKRQILTVIEEHIRGHPFEFGQSGSKSRFTQDYSCIPPTQYLNQQQLHIPGTSGLQRKHANQAHSSKDTSEYTMMELSPMTSSHQPRQTSTPHSEITDFNYDDRSPLIYCFSNSE